MRKCQLWPHLITASVELTIAASGWMCVACVCMLRCCRRNPETSRATGNNIEDQINMWLKPSRSARALMDTGTITSLVSEHFAKQHGLPVLPLEDNEYSVAKVARTSSRCALAALSITTSLYWLARISSSELVVQSANDYIYACLSCYGASVCILVRF